MKNERIYFTFNDNGTNKSTLLPLSEVSDYRKKYFDAAEVRPKAGNEEFDHFRFSVNGGFGLRTAAVAKDADSDVKQHLRSLKRGIGYNIDATYFFSETLGAGVKYTGYRAGKSNVALKSETGEIAYGKIAIHFAGPFFAMRLFDRNKKNCFIFNVGLGYVEYGDSASRLDDYKIKGSTFGGCMDLGYDVRITDKWAFGVQISEVGGSLSSWKRTDNGRTETVHLKKGEYEGLGHFQFLFGLRLNL